MKIRKSVLPFIDNMSREQEERLLVYERSNQLIVSSLIAFYKGEYKLTIAKCREALKLNPQNHEAEYWLKYYNIVIPLILQKRIPNPANF